VPLAASAGVALLAFQVYSSSLPRLFEPLQFGSAPALTSRSLSEATQLAKAQGLTAVVASSQPTDDQPTDVVIGQTPAPGAWLRRGDTINLTVSAGLRPPNVVGKSLDDAKATLVRSGWSVAPQVETRVANGAPQNGVVDQQPEPEQALTERGPVTLFTAVPNLAFGKVVRTSAGGQAPTTVDGQDQTAGWVPGNPPTWMEVEFGAPITVSALSLQVATEKSGPALIEVW